MTGDSELLRRYAEEGSEEAFAELVGRHIDFVYGVALRHARAPHRAEEAAQAVFTDLARKARGLAGRTELVGWLFVSARYAAAKIVRSEALRESKEREAAMMHRDANYEGRGVNWQELQPFLDDALQSLGDRDRSAVLLRCVKGLSFAEVGSALALSEDAARKRFERALDRLRRQFGGRGMTSTTEAIRLALAGPVTAAPAGLAAAVSSAATGAGGKASLLAALFQLMTTSKIMATAVLVAGLLSLGEAYHEVRLNHGTGAALASAQSEYALAAKSLEAARGATPRHATPHTANSAAAPLPSNTVVPGTPELAKIGSIYIRESTREQLEPLFRRLNLTPAQVDAVLDSHVIYNGFRMNNVEIIPSTPPDRSGGLAAAGLNSDQERQLKQYLTQESGADQVVAELAGSLFDSDPVSPALAGQLRKLIIDATPLNAMGSRSEQDTKWSAVIASARPLLTSTQLQALQDFAEIRTGESSDKPAAQNSPSVP